MRDGRSLLANEISSLKQAASWCKSSLQTGERSQKACLILALIQLFLKEDAAAFEALCLAYRLANDSDELSAFGTTIAQMTEAIACCYPFARVLCYATLVLTKAKELKHGATPVELSRSCLKQKACYSSEKKIIILAGATGSGSDKLIAFWEQPIREALVGFDGYLLTGGTDAGICGLAARVTMELHQRNLANYELAGYLPEAVPAGKNFCKIARTDGTNDFSVFEPMQMWWDLLSSGIRSEKVALLSLGGGEISAMELALAWALEAHTAVLKIDSLALRSFSSLLINFKDGFKNGMVLPAEPSAVWSFLR